MKTLFADAVTSAHWLKPRASSKLLLALVSGIFMGLTPAPTHAWFLAWIAIAPLWILVVSHEPEDRQLEGESIRTKSKIQNSKLGSARSPEAKTQTLKSKIPYAFAWGIGYHGLALFWITGVHPMTWMGVPWLASLIIAIFCWLFITLWGAAIVMTWAWLFTRLLARLAPAPSWLRVLLGTALWCAIESVWSYGPLYWTSISYTQSTFNLAILHLGQISGALTVTAAIVAFNGLLAEVWLQRNKREKHGKWAYLVPLAFLMGCHLLGFALYSRPLADAPSAALRVGIIQGNVPNTIKLYEEGWRRAIEGYTTGYRTLADQGVDVVLTPETALPTFWVGETRQRTGFYQAILEKQVPVWLGAFGQEGRSFTNSLFTVDGNGTTINEYRKVKLVPLGEYIPFENILGGLINRLSPLDAHLLAGQPHQIVKTPFGQAIAAICYESAFPEHFRYQAAAGGEFIITASNDAHYSPAMPAQHHAQDVMRAIETDRWAARATNTGYSAFVDPHGRTLWISDINTYALHTQTLYRRQTQTLYVRWGDWLTPLLLGVALVLWVREVRKNAAR